MMPGRHWTEGRNPADNMGRLDEHRRLVDARAAAFERRLFEATTRDLRALQKESAERSPRTNPNVLQTVDLTGDPDLDEDGRF